MLANSVIGALFSVQPYEPGLAFCGLETLSDGNRSRAVVVCGADADPIAGGALKLDDVGGTVFALQIGLQSQGGCLMQECADLDAPAATLVDRPGCAEDVNADLAGAGAPHTDGFGGADGEVKNAACDKRAAIGDAHDGGLAGLFVGYANKGSHGQGAVCGGDAVLVKDRAIRADAIVIWRAIPARDSSFRVDGCVGIDELLVRSKGRNRRGRKWRRSGRRLGWYRGWRRSVIRRLFMGAPEREEQSGTDEPAWSRGPRHGR